MPIQYIPELPMNPWPRDAPFDEVQGIVERGLGILREEWKTETVQEVSTISQTRTINSIQFNSIHSL